MRQGQHEPILEKRDGRPPGFVVRCRDCEFAHDAHGDTAAEAVASIRPTHERGHVLSAQLVDYTTGWGPQHDQPHPLYS